MDIVELGNNINEAFTKKYGEVETIPCSGCKKVVVDRVDYFMSNCPICEEIYCINCRKDYYNLGSINLCNKCNTCHIKGDS